MKEILTAALETPEEERGALVREVCRDDPHLLSEVEALLAGSARVGDTLETPASLEGLATSDDPGPADIGDHIGPYRIEDELGRGGMGVVYRAVRDDGELQRTVAVKVISRGLSEPGMLARFRQERQILVDAAHPNVAALLDAGTTEEGLPYFIMEFVDGLPIDEYCDRHRLSIPERVALFLQVCSAVELSHQHGVIHRDIKPGNVLVTEDGVPKLLDFGIAKFIHGAPRRASEAQSDRDRSGSGSSSVAITVGAGFTPRYASPEQLAGGDLDPRTDVYSLGIVLYILLCGRHPTGLDQGVAADVVLAKGRELLPPSRMLVAARAASSGSLRAVELDPAMQRARCGTVATLQAELEGDLDRIALQAIRESARDRYASVHELRWDLRGWLKQRETASPETRRALPPSWARTRPWLGGALLGVAAVVSALGLAGPFATSHGNDLLDVRTVERLTDSAGLELDPAISPDGRLIAYAGGLCGNTDILVQEMDPGRDWIAETLALTSGLAGEHRHPRWSPDGRTIVFEAWDKGVSDIYLVAVTGGVPTRLGGEDVAPGRRSPDWSPEGQRIAYARADGLYLFDLTTGSERQLAPLASAAGLRWSSSGDALVATVLDDPEDLTALLGRSRHTSLWWVRLPDGETWRLTEHAWANSSPGWVGGDSEIWFVSDRGGARDLYALPAPGRGSRSESTPRRLTAALRAGEVDVARDRRHVVYTFPQTERDVYAVAVPEAGEASMTDAVRVTHGAMHGVGLDVSPDGTWLVYDSDGRGRHAIIRRSLVDGLSRLLVSDPSVDLLPAISPDGGWVAFYSMRAETPSLFVTDSVGAHLLQASRRPVDAGCTTPECLLALPLDVPAAGWIAPGDLTGEDLGATALFPLTLRRSPDGSRLAAVVDGRISISGPERRVVSLGESRAMSLGWDPRGRVVYAAAADPAGRLEIWSVPVAGAPRRIVGSTAEVAAHPTAVASDGTRVFFRLPRCAADLWVLELGG